MIWGGGDGDFAFEVEGEGDGEGEMIDDFGYDLRKNPSSSSSKTEASERGRSPASKRMSIPGSWEVD